MADIQSIKKELEANAARQAQLQKDLAAAEAEKFTSLPKQVGLKTVDALIKALIPYASGVTKGKLKAALATGAGAAKAKPVKVGKRKPRARLDDAAKAKIVTTLKAGEKTAAEVAKEFDVSMATVNSLKADAGLTKKRK